jgi:hypothetical protein
MNCPDCNVAPGQWHEPACLSEQCPYCGDPLVGCGCREGRPPLDDRLCWGGVCPWLAACLRLGLFERRVGNAWVPCLPHDPGACPDLGGLERECFWNRPAKRYERRKAQPQ